MFVTFDTNAYRELVYGKSDSEVVSTLERLLWRERHNGVQALANPFVLLELAAHLSDSCDRAYHDCRAAIRALVRHCAVDNSGVSRVAVLADSESNLCKALYGRIPPRHEETTEKLCKLATYIAQDHSEIALSRVRRGFVEIKDVVDRTEARFVSDMKHHVILGLNPGATDWEPLKHNPCLRDQVLSFLRSPASLRELAKAQVYKAALLLGIAVGNNEAERLSQLVLKEFKTALQLYNEILTRIVVSGCNIEKKNRGNWVWDIQIAFSISPNAAIENRPVRLVTSDRDIIAAAHAVGASDAVLSLAQYQAVLESDAASRGNSHGE